MSPVWSVDVWRAWSVTLKTKKSLVATCRQWRAWSIEFLFRHIRIFRIEDLKELLQVLQDSAKASKSKHGENPVYKPYGLWVREVILHYTIPQDFSDLAAASWLEHSNALSLYDESHKSLYDLISCCNYLTSFIYQPTQPNNRYGPVNVSGVILRLLPDAKIAELENLVLQGITVLDTELTWIASLCPKLRSLTVSMPAPCDQRVSLPTVQHLTILIPDDYASRNREVTGKWNLPKLQTLELMVADDLLSIFDYCYLPLIQDHGEQLQRVAYLAQPEFYRATSESHLIIPKIVAMCPNLTHLTYKVANKVVALLEGHANLRIIGLSVCMEGIQVDPEDLQRHIIPLLNRTRFPQLKAISLADWSNFFDMVTERPVAYTRIPSVGVWEDILSKCREAGVALVDYKGVAVRLDADEGDIDTGDSWDMESYVPSSEEEYLEDYEDYPEDNEEGVSSWSSTSEVDPNDNVLG